VKNNERRGNSRNATQPSVKPTRLRRRWGGAKFAGQGDFQIGGVIANPAGGLRQR